MSQKKKKRKAEPSPKEPHPTRAKKTPLYIKGLALGRCGEGFSPPSPLRGVRHRILSASPGLLCWAWLLLALQIEPASFPVYLSGRGGGCGDGRNKHSPSEKTQCSAIANYNFKVIQK